MPTSGRSLGRPGLAGVRTAESEGWLACVRALLLHRWWWSSGMRVRVARIPRAGAQRTGIRRLR
eukprot:COSAG06_NODE_9828_length_1808_cov_1.481568_1_plen_63_part_01